MGKLFFGAVSVSVAAAYTYYYFDRYKGISVSDLDGIPLFSVKKVEGDEANMKESARKKPMTTAELFDKINGILKEKGKLPDILDYGLATHSHVPIINYEFEIRNNLDYRSNSWKKVLTEIVYRLQKEYKLRVYFDKEFASETNIWIEQFVKNMDSKHCKACLCFFDEGYVTSYAFKSL